MSKCLIANISKEMIHDLKLDYSYLSDQDLHTKMKDLVLQSNQEQTRMSLSNSFVYMFDYGEDKMNEITDSLKSKGINAIFIASTPHNLSWTLKDLLDEVMQEHHLFQAKNRLKELLQKKVQVSQNENKKQIEKILMEAFIIYQGSDVNAMEEMIKRLENL